MPCENTRHEGKNNRDHIPTKALLNHPYPENLPIVSTCQECNSGFAQDEEYLAGFLASVISGSSTPDQHRFPVAARILNHNPRLRIRIEHSRRVQETPCGSSQILWNPEIERIKRVIVKNARGHIFLELKQSVAATPSRIEIIPLERMSIQEPG